MNRILLISTLYVLLFTSIKAQTIADFENLTLLPNSYWNGAASVPQQTTFSSGNALFVNNYDTSFGGVWGGFGYSNIMDSVNGNYMNQYAAVTATGYSSSAKYAVAYQDYNSVYNKIILDNGAMGKVVQGFYITNTTWAYKEMLNGGSFTKKFGGVTGIDPDYFRLNISGWYKGSLLLDTATFYLADFRDNNSANDYIVKDWRWFDLNFLGNVDSLNFWFESSDTSSFGINTPTYFCMDNFTTADTPLDLDTQESKNTIRLYPNPVTHTLTIHTNEQFTIYNSLMQAVYTESKPINSNLYTVDCSQLNNGVYFLKTTSHKVTSFIKK